MGFIVFLASAVAVAAMMFAREANRRASEVEKEIGHLRLALENLGRRVGEMRKEARAATPQPEAAAPAPDVAPAPPIVTTDAPSPGLRPPSPAAAGEGHAPEPLPPAQPLPTPQVPQPQPSTPPAAQPPPLPSSAAAGEGGRRPGEGAPPRIPPITPPPPPPAKPFDWESLIGVKLFSWIAGIAVVLAALFFLKYSVEHGWLQPPVRAAIGLLSGAALIVVCELRIARGYATTANAMLGAGIATLYATLFATHALWHLLPPAVVFPLMILVTGVAVWLSIRRESLFIALLGLVGGFATPAMLSTGENRPIGLFAYLLLLNAGLAWVAYKRRWTPLTLISIAFTAIYQWAWTMKFLSASQLPLAAGIFVVFALTAAASLWIGRRSDDKQQIFDRVAIAGAAMPLLFGVFAAAVPAYGERFNVLFGFLLLVAGGLAVIAIKRGPEWLQMLGGVMTLLVFAIWRAVSFKPEAWPGILVWVVLFVTLYIVAASIRRTDAVFIAPALLFLFPTFAFTDLAESPWLLFGILFVLLGFCAAYAIRYQHGSVYFVAAFFAIATEAVWSAKHLTHDLLLPGLAIYAIFAIFFLGVPMLARRLGRALEPRGGVSVLVVLSIAMLLFLAGDAIADASLWGLALMLGILNAGALLEARFSANPVLSAISMILSWIVIGVWWGAATITAALIPALMVVGLFSVLVVGGNLWASRADPDDAPAFEGSIYLALAGHTFLVFVASQEKLAFPPWPLFAILGLLDLAIGVGALWLRREKLMTSAIAASQVVLLVWASNADLPPWPNVALVATLAVTALALVWHRIDRKFAPAVMLGAFIGQFVAMAAGSNAQPPLFATLLITHVLLLIAIFLVAWTSEEHAVVTVAAVTAAIATAAAPSLAPGRTLVFAGAIYALFLAYPLLLGRRAKQSIHPYLGPIIASGVFFFFAYDALTKLGYKPYIGALPVLQAILLVILLMRLLQIERDVERMLSRLALVAAASLAFITLAIPLQLDKQWITLGWALEGAALIWLFHRIPHRGLLMWGGALLGVVFARLTFNPAIFEYHARSSTPIVNWYLYTYLVCAIATYLGAYFMPRQFKPAIAALNGGATVLLFFLLNIEIADFYSTGSALTFNFLSSSIAQDLTYTMGWALFAVALLVAGIALHTRSARVAAIVLLAVTILKCFLHDLGRLGGLYRVVSLLGLAASLVVVGLLLQKYVIRKTTEAEAT